MPHHPITNAEKLPYWKTSRSDAESWVDKAEREIERYGGEVTARFSGRQLGREAHMLAFTFGEDRFQLVWPVLESGAGDAKSARRQAATMLYHDVKARSLRVAVFGARVAFFDALLIDGRPVIELAAPELAERAPKLLAP